MGSSPVLWDDRNLHHVTIDHPRPGHRERLITMREVAEVRFDARRIEGTDPQHWGRFVIGSKQPGRLWFVAYIRRRRGRYPIHAHQRRRPKP